MPLHRLDTGASGPDQNLLSPIEYDADSASIRSDQDTDSDDDQLQSRARNSRELRARDRIVLMEEEETDKLVTDARRRQDRQQQSPARTLTNPLNLFSRRRSDASRTQSPTRDGLESPDDLVSEKRQNRRDRRKEKRERLLTEAEHGEDGELMYEMEEGGMKEGSSTGDSSERDDSDEVDRRGLQSLAIAKANRSRNCRRWLFIHTMIAVAFALLVLGAWRLSLGRYKPFVSQELVSNGTALFAPTTILISLDGFRADFLQRGLTPRLNAFIKEGVSPLYMTPSFPSVTFPNHHTLATGLYPESHGIVGNTFFDPALGTDFYYTDPARSLDPKWWMGEPFWVTAEKQGIRTAIHMWPGSEAHILGVEPSFLDKYNGKEKLPNKVKRIFEFLDKPGKEDPKAKVEEMRPQIIAAYVPNVDSDGHKYGPNSTEIRMTIKMADDMLDDIFKGLEERNLTQIVNVIVVSDHGMATTDSSRLIQLEDLVDVDKIQHIDGWPLVGIRLKNHDDLQDMYEQASEVAEANPNFKVYLRDINMPERYHFSHNDRIAPLWIVPKTGWVVVPKDEYNVLEDHASGKVYQPRGLHGYDHEHPLMRAIFVARGPAFPHQPNSRVEDFQNTEVYNILCDSIGLRPMPNNGTLRLPLQPVGLHSGTDAGIETPPDPEISHSSSAASPTTQDAPAQMPTTTTSKTLAIDPVFTGAMPTKSVGVDHPTVVTSSASETKPTQDSGIDEGEDKGGVDQGESAIHDFWDWITGKIDELWGKLTGSGGS